MKRTAFLLTVGVGLLALGLCGTWAANGQEPADALRLLQAENTLLKATLAQRDKEIESLKTEIATLRVEKEKLARKPNTPGIVVSDGTEVVYEGKPRTREWFEQMYVKYCNKVILVDGKAILVFDDKGDEVGGYHTSDGMWSATTPVGAVLRSPRNWTEVLSVIADSEYLVIRRGVPSQTTNSGFGFSEGLSELLFHVKGAAVGLVDGAEFPQTRMVYVGTYRYSATSGAAKTVQSFVVYTPSSTLTREQFADALKQGLKMDTAPPKGDGRSVPPPPTRTPPTPTPKPAPRPVRIR